MVRCTELTRFTPALFAPRFRLSVGTLVTHGKGGILSLNQDSPTGAPEYVTDGGRDVSPKAVTETDTIRAHVDATDYWDEEDD
ncbi:hypothetical protein [Natrinema sp. HArc-T2]|uniref:hypothetical protein n=1 Tax=Natrinema sp. HArc-T2 TaxID=3242701 RepID=UPI00359D635A